MPIIELRLSKYYFYLSLYSKELNGNYKERVFQYWCFVGASQCCVRSYGKVCEIGLNKFGSSGVIIGVVELLANSIFGVGETRLSLHGKRES